MALYDRNYMRFEPRKSGWSMLGWLLAINLGVFLIQSLVTITAQQDFLAEYLALNGDRLLEGYVWSLLTYSILHAVSNPLHIIMNMLGLFLIGRIVQQDIGEQKLLALYLFTALTGALLFLSLNLTDGGYLIGASAAVLGILTIYCLMHMEEQITLLLFFVLPVTLKPKYVLWGLLGIELLRLISELQGTTYVSASAHLGGMLGAYIFYKHLLHRDSWFETPKRKRPTRESGRRRKKRSKVAASLDKPRFTVNLSSRRELRSEVDRILDKINAQGFGSLSEEEKRTLDQARDILSK